MRETFSNNQLVTILCIAIFPWLIHGLNWIDILIQEVDHCPQLGCDFTRHYFPQVQLMWEGRPAFQTGWFYPPLLAILLQPLVLVSDPLAVWLVLQILCLIGMVILVSRWILLSRGVLSLLCSLAVVTTSFPIIHSLKWGQISLFIAFGLIVSLFEWRERRYGYVMLGFLGGLKVYPLYMSFCYLLERKIYRFALAMVWFLCFALFLPIWAIGLEATQQYYLRMQSGMVAMKMMASTVGGQSIGISAFRWFQDALHVNSDRPVEGALLFDSQVLYMVFFFGAIPLLLGLILTSIRKNFSLEKQTSLVILGVHLLTAPAWHHYFAFVPFLWLVAWKEAGAKGKKALWLLFLVERIPIVTIGLIEDAYHWYSASGMTTIVCCGIFAVLRFSQAERATSS